MNDWIPRSTEKQNKQKTQADESTCHFPGDGCPAGPEWVWVFLPPSLCLLQRLVTDVGKMSATLTCGTASRPPSRRTPAPRTPSGVPVLGRLCGVSAATQRILLSTSPPTRGRASRAGGLVPPPPFPTSGGPRAGERTGERRGGPGRSSLSVSVGGLVA